jgi:uncharacterized protein (TIGR00730 family)
MLQKMQFFIATFFKLFRVFFQMLSGSIRLANLNFPTVTIFGGHDLKQEDLYAKKAYELARLLARNNFSLLTGGGPGIMQAASQGARSVHGKVKVIGIGVTQLDGKNPYLTDYFEIDRFYGRKWLLMRFSKAFVFFPGGYGTFDELFEVLNLVRTKRTPQVPIILIGHEFWRACDEWLRNEVVKHGGISEKDLNLYYITDDVEQALCIISEKCHMPLNKKIKETE